jgi:hypothetical protein
VDIMAGAAWAAVANTARAASAIDVYFMGTSSLLKIFGL